MSDSQSAGSARQPHVDRHAPVPTDTLGCIVRTLHGDQEMAVDGLRLYRKRCADGAPRSVETPASERGHLQGLSHDAGKRGLSRRQQALATEMLRCRLDGDVLIAGAVT